MCFHLEKYLETSEGLVQHLLRSTCVDDIISSGPTEDEAFNLYTASKKIFREGGFNLRKFLTNSKHLQERIDLQEGPKPNNSSIFGDWEIPRVVSEKVGSQW